MVSKVSPLDINLRRTSVPDALSRFVEYVLPELQDASGYEGVYFLANAEGRGLIVSFWDSEASVACEPCDGGRRQLIEQNLSVFRYPPGRESYEVLFADPPGFPELDELAASRLTAAREPR